MDTCSLYTRPQGPFSANPKNFVRLFAVDEAARFLFPMKQKQNDFYVQSDGALIKNINISINDVSTVQKTYGLCSGNSPCKLIKLHMFKSDACTNDRLRSIYECSNRTLSPQIPG